MQKTTAKIISEPIYHRIGFMEFYKVNLENKDGVFECSFGKKIFQDYSLEKKICLLKCKKGHWGFVCKELEFLENNEELASWEEIAEKEKKSQKARTKNYTEANLLSDDDIFSLLTNQLNLVPQQKGWEAFFFCPFHNNSETGKLTLDLNTKNFICSSFTNCQYKKIGDIFDFWAKYKNISLRETREEIIKLGYLEKDKKSEIKVNENTISHSKVIWETIAKFVEKPIWKEFQSIRGNYGYYRAKLENKDGVFSCSFGKEYLENYSEKSKTCFLKCKTGKQGFNCRGIEFLDNNQEITSWEEVIIKKKRKTESIEETKSTDSKIKLTISDKKIELNLNQKKVVNLVLEGKNVCFLGEAGTGKSFLLKYLIEILKEEYQDELFITSYTGRTAINIHGQTLHSFAGIGVAGEADWHQIFAKISRKKKIIERWKNCKVLIIDEISMLNGELFDKLEIIARQIKNSDKPFGGIQLIVCGDFYQLSPIEKDYKWCFETNSWNICFPNIVSLNQIYRQADNKFINLLQDVRNNYLSSKSFELLESLKREPQWPDDGIKPTQLYSTNEEVNNINIQELIKIPTSSIIYYARDKENQAKTLKSLTKDCLAPEKLELKIGAQVMLTVNQFEKKLVNGSQGIIINFKEEEGKKYPIVKFSSGKIVVIKPFEHKLLEYRNNQEIILASRCQIPLILCWAITIHKSQGQTIERLKIDCEKIWAEGQLYVALSRATNIEYLQVINFHKGRIKSCQRVKRYYENLKTLSI